MNPIGVYSSLSTLDSLAADVDSFFIYLIEKAHLTFCKQSSFRTLLRQISFYDTTELFNPSHSLYEGNPMPQEHTSAAQLTVGFILSLIVSLAIIWFFTKPGSLDKSAHANGLKTLKSKHKILRLKTTKRLQVLRPVPSKTTKKPSVRVSLYPKAGWRRFFPKKKPSTLLSRSTLQVLQELGEPPYMVRKTARSTRKDLWIYLASKSDPTALYLYFTNGRLTKTRFDAFSGSISSDSL